MVSRASITDLRKEWDPWAGPHGAIAKIEPAWSPEGRDRIEKEDRRKKPNKNVSRTISK